MSTIIAVIISIKNVTSTFFNTVNLLPKDLRFKHGGTKLVSCPGHYLTSLRPCMQWNTASTAIGVARGPKEPCPPQIFIKSSFCALRAVFPNKIVLFV